MIKYLVLLFAFFFFTVQQHKLVKVKIDKNMSVKLPEDFSPLPASELGSKYISYRSPIAFYSDPSKEIDFSVNYSVSNWPSSDLEIVQSFYKSNVANLFDETEFINETIEEINGRDYIVFEFISSISETQSVLRPGATIKKYYYIQYTMMEGHVLIFSFSTPQRVIHEWQTVAREIMHSIKVDW